MQMYRRKHPIAVKLLHSFTVALFLSTLQITKEKKEASNDTKKSFNN